MYAPNAFQDTVLMWLPRNVFHKPHAPTVKMLVEESALTFAILASTSMKESASMNVFHWIQS